MPSFFFVNWEKLSLRGRRMKGKGKGIRARDRAHGRRDFIISLARPNSLSTRATRARKKFVARAKFFYADQTYLIFWLFSLPSPVGVSRFYILFSHKL